MLTKIFSVSMLLTFFSVDLNKCTSKPNKQRISVVGTAITVKNSAAVQADDSLRYYLDGISDWDEKYKGKRVRVTGELFIATYEENKSADTKITVTRQVLVGTKRTIKKPKWRLVE